MITASQFTVVPGSALPSQPFWSELHETIETAFRNQRLRALPPSWHRLHPDPSIAAPKLARELGGEGLFAVMFIDGRAVACGGIVPFRGTNWVEEVKDAGAAVAETADGEIVELASKVDASQLPPPTQINLSGSTAWEICCFCVHPQYRNQGLAKAMVDKLAKLALERGANKLYAGFIVEESGTFWPRLGFQTISGAGGVWKKGFTPEQHLEPIKKDLHFGMGVRELP